MGRSLSRPKIASSIILLPFLRLGVPSRYIELDITAPTIAPPPRTGLGWPHGSGGGGVVGVPGARRRLRPRRCRGRDGGLRRRPRSHPVAILGGRTSGRAGGAPRFTTWMAGLPGSFTIDYASIGCMSRVTWRGSTPPAPGLWDDGAGTVKQMPHRVTAVFRRIDGVWRCHTRNGSQPRVVKLA